MSDPMTNDVTNDLFNIAPMDFEPGLMEITIPGREPFIREVVGPGRSGGVFPLRYAQHLIALEFGVKDEEVSFDMPVYDNDEDAAICSFTQDVVYGVWQGGDINDWCRADIDNPPADYNLIDTPPAMVWSSVEAAQVFINTTEEWAPREIRPYFDRPVRLTLEDFIDLVPMDFHLGVLKIVAAGHEPSYIPVMAEMSLRDIRHEAAQEFGVKDEEVTFEPTPDTDTNFMPDELYGIWCESNSSGGDTGKPSWLGANIVYDGSESDPIDFDEGGDLPNMVWVSKAIALAWAADNKTPGVTLTVRPYLES